jgi:hypothetical protein
MAEEIFVSFVKNETDKGYVKPKYPYKLWTEIVRTSENYKKTLQELNFVTKKDGILKYTLDYCEDEENFSEKFQNLTNLLEERAPYLGNAIRKFF